MSRDAENKHSLFQHINYDYEVRPMTYTAIQTERFV